MRQLTVVILFTFSLSSLFGQTEVELYFKNDCDNSIKRLEFELLNLNDSKEIIESKNGIALLKNKGLYLLTSYYERGDMVGSFNHTIQINDLNRLVDTLNIPKIKFTTERVLHSRYWNYFNCDKLCDGRETDFYANGQKRLEGEFKNGKPSHLTEYREDGTKETESWYVSGTTLYTRVDYFDEAGKLDEYDKYINRKRKTIKTTYTAQGKRSGREVIKHGIEK
jgi:antitoxin component YwqK of YwqJK toxin-antitoxin module